MSKVIAAITYPITGADSIKFIRGFKEETNGAITPLFTVDPMHATRFGPEVSIHMKWLEKEFRVEGENVFSYSVMDESMLVHSKVEDEKDYTSVDVAIVVNSNLDKYHLYNIAKEKGWSYKQDTGGHSHTIGRVEGKPVCVSPLIHVIEGIRVLAVEPTSGVVDFMMVDAWIKAQVGEGVSVLDDAYSAEGKIQRMIESRVAG